MSAELAELREEVLTGRVRKLEVTYFRGGSVSLGPTRSNDRLYIVRSGAAKVRDKDKHLLGPEAGESFGC